MTQPHTPLRVLVVDDDAMSRDLLCVLLEGQGYAVESAESGAAALALLACGGAAPDLVLADVQMPGDTGSRLAGKLRRACPPAALLLAISGSRPPQKAISRFDGFLLKPFTMEEVAAAVSSPRPVTKELTEKKGTRSIAPPLSPSSASQPSIDASAPPTASRRTVEGSGQELRAKLTAGPGESPALDETIYQRLADAIPLPQLQEMYAMCMQDARERIALMRRLAEQHDQARFLREAHALKGSCGMLGATQLHAMAAELERNGLETAAPEVNSLDELAAACDRLERMLGSRV